MRPIVLLVLALAALVRAPIPQALPAEALTVMSFNIRYGTANDGDNRWANRREFLFDVIREADADVIGLQEALDFQIDEILAAVSGYASLGVGRNDGRRRGEFAAILVRARRLRVDRTGTFWFSDTPEVVASTSWGNRIIRICTWVRLVDRDGRAFWVFNVHLDHVSQPSREQSTALLAARIAARVPAGDPVIVTGDLNAGESNPAVMSLTAGPATRPGRLVDTFRVVHPSEAMAGTFTGFKPNATGGDKIDYVFVEPGTEVLDAAIVRTSRNGRYPSDHFPVTAIVRLK
ncbi:MAG TPA: endonuclease/exonuclease/phosphatase family protein [Vicinamibacterales bacterium]|nr:endonuclease/exonuclease/phosphatase family protein [Vicinamibacterales bacterium]